MEDVINKITSLTKNVRREKSQLTSYGSQDHNKKFHGLNRGLGVDLKNKFLK